MQVFIIIFFSERYNVMGIQCWFLCLALHIQRLFWIHSLLLFIVDGSIPSAIHWKYAFLNLLYNLSTLLFSVVDWTLSFELLSPLKDTYKTFHTKLWYFYFLLINLFSYGVFQTGLLLFHNSPSFFVPRSQTFEKCVAETNQNRHIFTVLVVFLQFLIIYVSKALESYYVLVY